MKVGKLWVVCVLLVVGVFVFVPRAAYAASCQSNSIGGGNWNNAATWTGCSGGVPQTGDDVEILSGDVVTLPNNFSAINSGLLGIVVDSGGTLEAATVPCCADLGGNTVLVNGTFRIGEGSWVTNGIIDYQQVGTFELVNTGGGNYGISGNIFWPTGLQAPLNVNALVTAVDGIDVDMPRTVDGTFRTTGNTINAQNLTVNGALQIDPGGFLSLGSPTYGAASTLLYNAGGTYGRGLEWPTTGVHTVQVSNSTTLNYPNGSTAARTISGDLIIEAGSALHMDYGAPGLNAPFSVAGNASLDGTLTLGDAIGGDLIVGGNWTFDSTATLNTNSRAVFFDGAGTQTIGGTGRTDFAYLIINSGATVLLPDVVDVTMPRANVVTNNGALVQGATSVSAATDFVHIRNVLDTTDTYLGLSITPGAGAPNLTVEIRGNAATCINGIGDYRDRCFLLNSSVPNSSANVTLYTTSGEDDLTDDIFFQFTGTWTPQLSCPDGVAVGGACGPAVVSLAAGNNYFLIGAAGSTPTAVTLQSIQANTVEQVLPVLLFLLFAVAYSIWWRSRYFA